jgi:hypothetical protein
METHMTEFIITAKAKDVRQFNLDMSALEEAIRPIAEKFGGELGMGPGSGHGGRSLTVSFNDTASASSFDTELQKAASERLFKIGPRKLPGMNIKQQ